MPDEPDNLVVQLLRYIPARQDEHSPRFDEIEAVLEDVRLTVANHDLRFDALEERVVAIREGTVSAIGFAADAIRAHIDLPKQIAKPTRRVEKLEAGR